MLKHGGEVRRQSSSHGSSQDSLSVSGIPTGAYVPVNARSFGGELLGQLRHKIGISGDLVKEIASTKCTSEIWKPFSVPWFHSAYPVGKAYSDDGLFMSA